MATDWLLVVAVIGSETSFFICRLQKELAEITLDPPPNCRSVYYRLFNLVSSRACHMRSMGRFRTDFWDLEFFVRSWNFLTKKGWVLVRVIFSVRIHNWIVYSFRYQSMWTPSLDLLSEIPVLGEFVGIFNFLKSCLTSPVLWFEFRFSFQTFQFSPRLVFCCRGKLHLSVKKSKFDVSTGSACARNMWNKLVWIAREATTTKFQDPT